MVPYVLEAFISKSFEILVLYLISDNKPHICVKHSSRDNLDSVGLQLGLRLESNIVISERSLRPALAQYGTISSALMQHVNSLNR